MLGAGLAAKSRPGELSPVSGEKQTFAIRGHVVDVVSDEEPEEEGTR